MEPNTNAASLGLSTSTCGVCGASNKAAAKFCRGCGASLAKPAAQGGARTESVGPGPKANTQSIDGSSAESSGSAQSQPSWVAGTDCDTVAAAPSAKASRGNAGTRLMAGAAMAIVGVVVIAAVAGYWWLNRQSERHSVAVLAIFQDSFDDNNIDPEKWTRSGNSVVEASGQMQVETSVTDGGGRLSSVWIPVNRTNDITIQKRTYLHYGNSRFQGNFAISHDGDSGGNFIIVHYGNMDNWNNTYCAVRGFVVARNGTNPHMCAASRDDYSSAITPVWDQWFSERIVYSPSTGLLSYYVDEQKKADLNVGALPAGAQRINAAFTAWGWWTGHQHYLDDFRITQDPQTTEPQPVKPAGKSRNKSQSSAPVIPPQPNANKPNARGRTEVAAAARDPQPGRPARPDRELRLEVESMLSSLGLANLDIVTRPGGIVVLSGVIPDEGDIHRIKNNLMTISDLTQLRVNVALRANEPAGRGTPDTPEAGDTIVSRTKPVADRMTVRMQSEGFTDVTLSVDSRGIILVSGVVNKNPM